MNAIFAEKYEVSVLTSEAIEVHLTYLRTGLDSVQAALPVLRDKIDLLSSTVDAKLEKTNSRIEAVNTSLSDKIEKAGARTDERIDKLSERVSTLSDGVAGVRAYQKAIFWVISLVGTICTAATLAQAFHWI